MRRNPRPNVRPSRYEQLHGNDNKFNQTLLYQPLGEQTEEERQAARITIAERAESRDEIRVFLAMLGLDTDEREYLTAPALDIEETEEWPTE